MKPLRGSFTWMQMLRLLLIPIGFLTGACIPYLTDTFENNH